MGSDSLRLFLSNAQNQNELTGLADVLTWTDLIGQTGQ